MCLIFFCVCVQNMETDDKNASSDDEAKPGISRSSKKSPGGDHKKEGSRSPQIIH